MKPDGTNEIAKLLGGTLIAFVAIVLLGVSKKTFADESFCWQEQSAGQINVLVRVNCTNKPEPGVLPATVKHQEQVIIVKHNKRRNIVITDGGQTPYKGEYDEHSKFHPYIIYR